jgi:hypothetical protein
MSIPTGIKAVGRCRSDTTVPPVCGQAYKIQPAELEVGTLTDAILTRMAVRDC